MLYPPCLNCSSFTPGMSACYVVNECENCALRPALLPCLCRTVDCIVVQVCWRKLVGTEDSSKHLEESTED